ncbi:LLM class flavin-dependent oxidoreductase [Kitasatospora sp. GP82]|uniref:LLM class flavin-dependent oxidoreductase n=1 Tax=Kitasatospora sp. GP82 TaxID=3035089 RepID=UPI002473FC6C|nr:LLM class flavin-dependent oxidoreductase [Kitasatospora sp. GP82]
MATYAALVHWTRAARLWQGQSLAVEAHQGFAHAAGTGFGVPTGLGVSLMPLRHPYEAAMQARSLALSTGHSVLAGFGPGRPSLQRAMRGEPYASPLTAAEEYVTIVRGLLQGQLLDFSGEYYHCEGALPPSPAPEVQVGLGVLRPGMARLAGRVADAAITWLTPASYLRETVLPALREGAEAVGRPLPRVVAMVPMALPLPDQDVEAVVVASSGSHMQAPHYADMLKRAGIDVSSSDPLVNARSLIEGGAFLMGEVDELVGQIKTFWNSGVDEVVINVTGVANVRGPQAAMRQIKTIVTALSGMEETR